MKKICTTCKEKKDSSLFNKNKVRKDGLNNVCRECSNKRSKKHYLDNKEEHRKNVKKRKDSLLKDNKNKIMNILINSSCTDCGNIDHRTFEFDHVNGDKVSNVSTLLGCGFSWDKIKAEIDKCEIVCANCHRIRSFKKSGSYRLLFDIINEN